MFVEVNALVKFDCMKLLLTEKTEFQCFVAHNKGSLLLFFIAYYVRRGAEGNWCRILALPHNGGEGMLIGQSN